MPKFPSPLILSLLIASLLAGCAALEEPPPAVESEADATPVVVRAPGDIQRIGELERQLAREQREQRQCTADKRRLEQTVKDLQKQNDDLQKKIDALLTIDRDLRNRNRTR